MINVGTNAGKSFKDKILVFPAEQRLNPRPVRGFGLQAQRGGAQSDSLSEG